MLHVATSNRHRDIVRTLLTHGAAANAHDQKGDTALQIACASEDQDLVKMLLSHGADINSQNRRG